MKDWEGLVDTGFILLVLGIVMLWSYLASACQSGKELEPCDTLLHSHPEAGHGPNPFDHD